MENSRIYITRIFAVSLVVLILVSSSGWEDKASFVSTALFFVGTVLAGIASLGRLWCSLYIAGYKTDRLITVGPYSMCRNPLYFFSFLGAVGLGFVSKTILIPLIIIVAFAIYYPLVIKSEEEELGRIHKKEYEVYLDKVPGFFPKLSFLTEPDEYIVKPLLFKKHIFDNLWFIWFIGIIEVIDGLHKLNVLPTICKIY